MAHLVRKLQSASEQRLNRDQSGGLAAFQAGGTPFSPQYLPFNAPGLAQCKNTTVFSCTAEVQTFLTYINYSPTKLDNISYRLEYYDDMEGQRTGVKTALSRNRPRLAALVFAADRNPARVSFYRSLNAPAFNGNANLGIAPNKSTALSARRTSSSTSDVSSRAATTAGAREQIDRGTQ